MARMRDLHTQHDGVIGSPRMREEFRYAVERCGGRIANRWSRRC